MSRYPRRPEPRRALLVLALSAAVWGCAHSAPHRKEAVEIDRRPTPAQPDSTGAVEVPRRTVVMTARTLRVTIAAIAQDTLAARAALDRCAGRRLAVDQEGVFDSTTGLLIQVREALTVVDLPRARSLARQARQLSTSLGCP